MSSIIVLTTNHKKASPMTPSEGTEASRPERGGHFSSPHLSLEHLTEKILRRNWETPGPRREDISEAELKRLRPGLCRPKQRC